MEKKQKGKYSITNQSPTHKTKSKPPTTHLPIIAQQVTVKNDPTKTKSNKISSSKPNSRQASFARLDEEQEGKPGETKLESHLKDLERKVTPKGIINEQLNVNMSIPPEREEGDRPNIRNIPQPLKINRPSDHQRRAPGPIGTASRGQDMGSKPYPPDAVVKRNVVNYRNIKIRMLMLEYLNGTDENRSFRDNFKRLVDFNLVNLKRNYVMLINEFLQLVALICFFLAFITEDFMKVFYGFFFSDAAQVGLLLYRVVGIKERGNLSKMKGLAPVEYKFGYIEIVMTLVVIVKDVGLYISISGDSNLLFFISCGLWVIIIGARFASLKFDSYFATTTYTYIAISLQLMLILMKVKLQSSGNLAPWLIPAYIYLAFPGLIYFILLISGVVVLFQRSEEGDFVNKKILAFFALMQSVEFILAYTILFLLKDHFSSQKLIQWFFISLIVIKTLLVYLNFRYTEDFVFR